MKTITIKVDDKYAGVISATFIGSDQHSQPVGNTGGNSYLYKVINPIKTYVSIISENIHDNMVITIDDKGNAKTEDKQDEKR